MQYGRPYYEMAIRLKPDYLMAHYGLGLAYILSSDRDSALKQFKILKTLNQELADRLFNLIYK
jgi:hypothetical protein